MNTGSINGVILNGATVPNWIVRAAVVATAVATVISANQTRTTHGFAYGDAVVGIHITEWQKIVAKATGQAGVSFAVNPTTLFAGKSNATATAFGAGAIRRDVFGQAGGDAHATGEALTAQAIGSASATSAASVVLCKPHVVFPGKSNTNCLASPNQPYGKVTRYVLVQGIYAGVEYTRAEASKKASGHSYYNHDGYVLNATSTATGTIPQDRIKIIATIGSFDFADATSASKSFVRYFGKAVALGQNTAQAVAPTYILHGKVNVTSGATATAQATRVVLPRSSANAVAAAYNPKARIKYVDYALADAFSANIAAIGVRKVFAMSEGQVNGFLIADLYGTQFRADAVNNAFASGNASAKQKHAGNTTAIAVVVAQITATGIRSGAVNDTATAMVGNAYAVSNSDIPAPAERYMTVPSDSRDMIIPFEDRTMMVTA